MPYPFHDELIHDDTKTVIQGIISGYLKINEVNEQDCTLLQLAATGNIEAVLWLSSGYKYPNVNQANNESKNLFAQMPPYLIAFVYGHKHLAEILLAFGADKEKAIAIAQQICEKNKNLSKIISPEIIKSLQQCTVKPETKDFVLCWAETHNRIPLIIKLFELERQSHSPLIPANEVSINIKNESSIPLLPRDKEKETRPNLYDAKPEQTSKINEKFLNELKHDFEEQKATASDEERNKVRDNLKRSIRPLLAETQNNSMRIKFILGIQDISLYEIAILLWDKPELLERFIEICWSKRGLLQQLVNHRITDKPFSPEEKAVFNHFFKKMKENNENPATPAVIDMILLCLYAQSPQQEILQLIDQPNRLNQHKIFSVADLDLKPDLEELLHNHFDRFGIALEHKNDKKLSRFNVESKHEKEKKLLGIDTYTNLPYDVSLIVIRYLPIEDLVRLRRQSVSFDRFLAVEEDNYYSLNPLYAVIKQAEKEIKSEHQNTRHDRMPAIIIMKIVGLAFLAGGITLLAFSDDHRLLVLGGIFIFLGCLPFIVCGAAFLCLRSHNTLTQNFYRLLSVSKFSPTLLRYVNYLLNTLKQWPISIEDIKPEIDEILKINMETKMIELLSSITALINKIERTNNTAKSDEKQVDVRPSNLLECLRTLGLFCPSRRNNSGIREPLLLGNQNTVVAASAASDNAYQGERRLSISLD